MPSNSTTTNQEILDQKAAADAFLARAAEMKKRTSWFATNSSAFSNNNKEQRSQRSSEVIRSGLTKDLTGEISMSDSDDDEDVTESTLLTTDETITEQGEEDEEGEEAGEDKEEHEDEYSWELSDEEYEEDLEDDCPDAKIPIVRVGGETAQEKEKEAEKGPKGGLNRRCSHSTVSETDSGWSNASDELDDDYDNDEEEDDDGMVPFQPQEEFNDVDPALEEPIQDVNDSDDGGKQEEEEKDKNNQIKEDNEGPIKKRSKSSNQKRKKKAKKKNKKPISKRPSFNWETMKSEDEDSDYGDKLDWLPSEIELERAMMEAVWEPEEDMPLPSHDDLLKRIEALEQELQEEKRQREDHHQELLHEQALTAKATSDRCDALELEVQEQTRIILRQQDMIAVLAKHVEEEQKQRKAMESKMLGLIEDLRFRSEIRKEWMIKEVERNKEHIRAQQKRSNIRDGIRSSDSSGSLAQYLDKSNPDHDVQQDSTSSTSTDESSSTICAGSTMKEKLDNTTDEPAIKLCDPTNETEEYYLGFTDKQSLRSSKPSNITRRVQRGSGPIVVEDPIPRSLKEVQVPPSSSTRRKSKRLSLPSFISIKTNTTAKTSDNATKATKSRRASTGAPLTQKKKKKPITTDTGASKAKAEEQADSFTPSLSRRTNRAPVATSTVTGQSTNFVPLPESHVPEKKKTGGQSRRVSAPPRMKVDALDRLSMKYRAAAVKMHLEPYMD